MKAKGYGSNSINVAKIYNGLISQFLIDDLEKDRVLEKINQIGIECHKTNTIMDSLEDKIQLAKFLINLN